MSLRTYLNLNFSAMSLLAGSDFTTERAKLDPIVQFSRESDGTRVNAFGIYEIVPSGQPRFDFDPNTNYPKGLIIEASGTNIVRYSSDLSASAWGKDANVTVGVAASLGNGIISGNFVDLNSAANSAGVAQTGQLLPSTAFAASFFVTTSGASGLIAVTNSGGSTYSGNFAVDSTLRRYSITGATGPTQTGASIYFRKLTGGVTGLYIGGVQIEQGGGATSYIPTNAIPATRSRDEAYVVDYSAWFNSAQGTYFTRYLPVLSPAPTFLLLTASGTSIATGLYYPTITGAPTGYICESFTYGPRGFQYSVGGQVDSTLSGVLDVVTNGGLNQVGLGSFGTTGGVTIDRMSFAPYQVSNFLLASTTSLNNQQNIRITV